MARLAQVVLSTAVTGGGAKMLRTRPLAVLAYNFRRYTPEFKASFKQKRTAELQKSMSPEHWNIWVKEHRRRKYGWNLHDLVSVIPPHPDYKEEDKSTWVHKNAYGIKFYRKLWKYPEPCYWTLTKYRPAQGNKKAAAYGVLTWRGQKIKGDTQRKIPGWAKRDWNINVSSRALPLRDSGRQPNNSLHIP
eukprot:g83099.t1